MSNLATEYLPSPGEEVPTTPGQGSGSNDKTKDGASAGKGSGVKKTPFDLRRQAWRCNDADLTTFAKLLFVRLTDMAFESEFKRGDGVLECSKKFLAADADTSVDTITRATRALEKSGFLWTKNRWNGSFEMTWWFVREWADDKFEYDRHSGSNYGKRVGGVQRNTMRGDGGKFAPNPNSQRAAFRAFLASQRNGSTVKAEISPDHGRESALSAPTNQPGQGRTISLDQPQESALTNGRNQPGQGRKVSPDTRQESARSGPTNQPGQGWPVPGLNTLRDDHREGEEDSFKRSTGLIAPGGGRGPKKSSRENTFLLDVGAMMERWRKGSSTAELKNSGAWWRLSYRADSELMERVLADTLSAVKEGRIKTTPGQHSADLWKRWGGKVVSA